MSEQIFEIPASTKAKAWIDNDAYLKMYQESVDDPKAFWDKQAERLDWFKKWDNTLDWDFKDANIRCYEGG
jgi:acetyl-CoA synthetase